MELIYAKVICWDRRYYNSPWSQKIFSAIFFRSKSSSEPTALCLWQWQCSHSAASNQIKRPNFAACVKAISLRHAKLASSSPVSGALYWNHLYQFSPFVGTAQFTLSLLSLFSVGQPLVTMNGMIALEHVRLRDWGLACILREFSTWNELGRGWKTKRTSFDSCKL